MRPELLEVLNHTKLGLENREQAHKKFINNVTNNLDYCYSQIDRLKEIFKSFEGLPISFKDNELVQFDESKYDLPDFEKLDIAKIKKNIAVSFNYNFSFNNCGMKLELCNQEIKYYYVSTSFRNFNDFLHLILGDMKGKTFEATAGIVDWLEDQQFNPEWKTSTVVNLLNAVKEDATVFPYLSDALQDAGCDNTIILNLTKFGNPQIVEWLNEGIK